MKIKNPKRGKQEKIKKKNQSISNPKGTPTAEIRLSEVKNYLITPKKSYSSKKSLQKRKDYYAKTDAQEQEYLKAERRKNATNPGAKLPKKKKSREAKK